MNLHNITFHKLIGLILMLFTTNVALAQLNSSSETLESLRNSDEPDYLAKQKSIVYTVSRKIGESILTAKVTIQSPDRVAVELINGVQRQVLVQNGDSYFIKHDLGATDILDKAFAHQIKHFSLPINIYQYVNWSGQIEQDTHAIDGANWLIISQSDQDEKISIWFDERSKLPFRVERKWSVEDQEYSSTISIDEFTEVSGINIPKIFTLTQGEPNQAPSIQYTVSNIEFNIEVGSDLFKAVKIQ